MWEKLRVVFTIPELRQKILLTLVLLAVYRVGFQIPLPIVDPGRSMQQFSEQTGGMADMLKQVAVFSASQLSQVTIFGLGIMPYISASIIFQLLGQRLSAARAAAEGRRSRPQEDQRIHALRHGVHLLVPKLVLRRVVHRCRRASCVPAFLNAAAELPFSWHDRRRAHDDRRHDVPDVARRADRRVRHRQRHQPVDHGGHSGRHAGRRLAAACSKPSLELGGGGGKLGIEELLLLALLFVAVVIGRGVHHARPAADSHAKRQARPRPPRLSAARGSTCRCKVNQAGVMPIIFASSLLMFPRCCSADCRNVRSTRTAGGQTFVDLAHDVFNRGGFVYNLLYVVLIYFFCYFWTAITFNPKDMAENLKNFGTFIPGYRPGKRTADYLEKVMVRITYVGAGVPGAGGDHADDRSPARWTSTPMVASFYGGTSLLIAVSVAFDLVQKIDSHLVMRNYKGLLE